MTLHDRETDSTVTTTVERWRYELDRLCEPYQMSHERFLTVEFDTLEEYTLFLEDISDEVMDILKRIGNSIENKDIPIGMVNIIKENKSKELYLKHISFSEIFLQGFGNIIIKRP